MLAPGLHLFAWPGASPPGPPRAWWLGAWQSRAELGEAKSLGKRLCPVHGAWCPQHTLFLHPRCVPLVLPTSCLAACLPPPGLCSAPLPSLDYFKGLVGLSPCEAVHLRPWSATRGRPSASPGPPPVVAPGSDPSLLNTLHLLGSVTDCGHVTSVRRDSTPFL